jgi:hypothetical protein
LAGAGLVALGSGSRRHGAVVALGAGGSIGIGPGEAAQAIGQPTDPWLPCTVVTPSPCLVAVNADLGSNWEFQVAWADGPSLDDVISPWSTSKYVQFEGT